MDTEPIPEPTRLYSKAEAATYLGGPPITVATIDGLIRRREIAFVQIGKTRCFTRAALDAYVAAHTVEAKPNPWGLSTASLDRIRSGRPAPTRKAS